MLQSKRLFDKDVLHVSSTCHVRTTILTYAVKILFCVTLFIANLVITLGNWFQRGSLKILEHQTHYVVMVAFSVFSKER